MSPVPEIALVAEKEPRVRHVPGEAGMWIFILGDMTIFAVMFGVYLSARATEPRLFALSAAHLSAAVGAINTLLLLLSSLLVVVAVRSMRLGIMRGASRLVAVAMACGIGFVVIKGLEWGTHLAHGFDPMSNFFWRYYYILTGAHLFHLLVGLAVLRFLYLQARAPVLTVGRFRFVEGGACYWHMVDLLWVVLFPLFYLAR
jgi:nitric oxide reductase NorE protein